MNVLFPLCLSCGAILPQASSRVNQGTQFLVWITTHSRLFDDKLREPSGLMGLGTQLADPQ